MRTRILPLFLCLLAAPALHAQFEFDTTTLAGRVMSRRMVAMGETPEIQERAAAGALDFSSFDVAAMDDTTLVAMTRLMVRGIEREESGSCPAALSDNSDPNAFFFVILASVTDSMEAEEWADMLERAIWGMVRGIPAGAMASGEELEARMYAVMENMSEQEMAVLEFADDDPGGAACMLIRILFQDLAREKVEVAGPLIRGMMAAGMQQSGEPVE